MVCRVVMLGWFMVMFWVVCWFVGLGLMEKYCSVGLKYLVTVVVSEPAQPSLLVTVTV